jgi:hypothetical protein
MSRRMTAAEMAALQEANRQEEAQRLKKLYGSLLPDVEFLRKRGFVIVKERGQVEIDGRPFTADEVRAKAARERRVAGVPEPAPVRRVARTASGLRVGDSVSLKAKRSAAAQVPLSVAKEKLSGAALVSKTKAERPSEDLGPTPRLEWLPLEQLGVDRRYQREMGKDNWAHVHRILREWTWLHYQPIVVAPEDGSARYVVIDGQHRLEAARKHPSIDRLPCYIVDAVGVAHQAKAFVALNARRIGVTRLQRFWAAHAAGEPTAKRIHRICSEAGVTITKSGGVLPPCTTFATFTIEKLLPLGGAAVTMALKILVETHGGRPDTFKSAWIYALAHLAAAKEFDRARLVKAMTGLDLDQVATAARSARAKSGGTMEKAVLEELRARCGPAAQRSSKGERGAEWEQARALSS